MKYTYKYWSFRASVSCLFFFPSFTVPGVSLIIFAQQKEKDQRLKANFFFLVQYLGQYLGMTIFGRQRPHAASELGIPLEMVAGGRTTQQADSQPREPALASSAIPVEKTIHSKVLAGEHFYHLTIVQHVNILSQSASVAPAPAVPHQCMCCNLQQSRRWARTTWSGTWGSTVSSSPLSGSLSALSSSLSASAREGGGRRQVILSQKFFLVSISPVFGNGLECWYSTTGLQPSVFIKGASCSNCMMVEVRRVNPNKRT